MAMCSIVMKLINLEYCAMVCYFCCIVELYLCNCCSVAVVLIFWTDIEALRKINRNKKAVKRLGMYCCGFVYWVCSYCLLVGHCYWLSLLFLIFFCWKTEKSADYFLSSESLIRQIPRMMGPGIVISM